MTGTVMLKIHQKVKSANGNQWVEVWSRSETVARMERVAALARVALATFRADHPGVEFMGTSTVETMEDW
jgi:hypothetical protein